MGKRPCLCRSYGPFPGPLVSRGGDPPVSTQPWSRGAQALPASPRCPWLGVLWAACLVAACVNLGPGPFSENRSEGNQVQLCSVLHCWVSDKTVDLVLVPFLHAF